MKIICGVILLLTSSTAFSQWLMSKTAVPRQPYIKYVIEEGEKDSLTFYLTEFDKEKKLPLVIFVQGSGNQSLFTLVNGMIRPNYGHTTLPYIYRDKAKLLIVEKPGVQYLQTGEVNRDFDKKFSLESWTNNLIQAVDYILKNELVDRNNILVIGHSEGGLVAAHLTNRFPKIITHTAILAGEGPTQLFSLFEFAKDGTFFNNESFTKEQRIDSLLNVWKEIQADPLSTTKYFWGFTYLRWSSFLKTSVLEELSSFNGKIFIAQGEKDSNVFPYSADALYTGLLAKQKRVTYQLIANADHSFSITNDAKRNGWNEIHQAVRDWFVEK